MTFLSFYNQLPSKQQKYNIIYQDNITDTLTVEEFLERYQPTSTPFNRNGTFGSTSAESINKALRFSNAPPENDNPFNFDNPSNITKGTFNEDLGLECEWDPDYSCEAWLKNGLIEYIMEARIEFVVNQEYIDSTNDIRRTIISSVIGVAVGGIIGRVGMELNAIILPAVTATAITQVSDSILPDLQWYKVDLKPGDKLITQGGKTTVIRASTANTSGGSGENLDNPLDGGETYGWWNIFQFNWNCSIIGTDFGCFQQP